ncbi:MAG: HEPN domain-containing protein, partial [Anaerolineales bacterium]|nr:HEPN domain-containing protein [Anaerolineales bacterium]
RNPIETPAQWLRYALGDIGVAERELQYEQPSCHTVCFLCQSAAEKFLKGYLIAQGWSLAKTHDMVALLGFCSEYDAGWRELMTEGTLLNEYVITGRYPDDISIEDIGLTQAKEALEAARQIKMRVLALIKSE